MAQTLKLVIAPIDVKHNTSHSIREDTAELASRALSDSKHTTPPRRHSDTLIAPQHVPTQFPKRHQPSDSGQPTSGISSKPKPIQEVSEPTSSGTSRSSSRSHGRSALTDMIRRSPPSRDTSPPDQKHYSGGRNDLATVGEGIISQPTERTTLILQKAAYRSDISPQYGSIPDLESLSRAERISSSNLPPAIQGWGLVSYSSFKAFVNPRRWSGKTIWQHGIRSPLSYIPSVILGLLLNVLDALSYGMPDHQC